MSSLSSLEFQCTRAEIQLPAEFRHFGQNQRVSKGLFEETIPKLSQTVRKTIVLIPLQA